MPRYSQTTIDQPLPVVALQRRWRRTAIVAVTFTVALATTAVAWSAQSTDGAPGTPSSSRDRQETPSLLESPAEFDRAIADAVGNSEEDSIMHNGDAFDRAVAVAAAGK